MKLIPLGDRVVLKQWLQKRQQNLVLYYLELQRKTTAGRSNRCWTWWRNRWKRSKDGSYSWFKVIYSKYAGTEVKWMMKNTLS